MLCNYFVLAMYELLNLGVKGREEIGLFGISSSSVLRGRELLGDVRKEVSRCFREAFAW